MAMVEHHYRRDDMKRAFELLEKMRQSRIILKPYIDSNMIRTIHEAVGEPLEAPSKRTSRHQITRFDKDDEDGVEEDIQEDFQGFDSDSK